MLQKGNYELFKGALHAMAGLLVGTFAVYNAAAFLKRRDYESHLAINAVVYTGATIWEVKKVLHHWMT